jgi:rod shape-determining protein MreC
MRFGPSRNPSQSSLFHRQSFLALRLACAVTGSVALLVLSRGEPAGTPLSAFASRLGSVIERPIAFSVSTIASIGPTFTRHEILERRIGILEHRLLRLRARLARDHSLVFENERLKALLGRARTLKQAYRIVHVLRVDLDPYRQELLLGAGQTAALRPGDAVVDARGLVGQIVTTTAHTARVLLITDPGQMVPVEVAETGLLTFSVGTGSPSRLRLPFIANQPTGIRPGQLLISSGLGGHYPHGFPVAVVTRVESRPDRSFAYVTARPLAALSEDRELLVLTGSAGRPPSRTPAR